MVSSNEDKQILSWRQTTCQPLMLFPHSVPGHALHEKVYRDRKRGRSTSQQPGTKSVSRSADKLLSTAAQLRVNREFCSSIGLHRISLVRASGERFRRPVPDSFEGTKKACPLGDQFCWHPVLPDPAPPSRHAPRPDSPVVCLGFGLDRFT